ncbi:MAG: ABC transporter permease [Planctomycetota bacterium]
MTTLILRRLIQLPLILAVIFAVTFTLVWVLPGNPLDRADGRRPPPEVEQAMKARYNLDSPTKFIVEYFKGVAVGDFGPSLSYRGQEVRDIIGKGLPVSASLGIAALVVALFLGTFAGVVGALKPGSPLDSASLGVALLGISLPNFVTGTILLVLFAGVLRWVPVGGWNSPTDMILPAITLGLAPAAYIARLIRLGLADIMHADYIRTARAKGLSQTKALFKHALKVAYLPVLSFLGPAAASVMTGSFVVEKVFNIPGIGEYFVNSVLNKDQSLILGIVLVYATMLIFFNLVVDVAYAWLDPRIEL